MKNCEKNICKKLNLLTLLLSFLVFAFSAVSIASFVLSGNSANLNAIFGNENVDVEFLTRYNLAYMSAEQNSVNYKNVNFTLTNGAYGETAILECLETIQNSLNIAKFGSEEYGTKGYGYSVELFGTAIAVPSIAADLYTVRQNTYVYAEESPLNYVYKESAEKETSGTGKGRNACDRIYFDGLMLKQQQTNNVSINGKAIVSNFNNCQISTNATSKTYSAWDVNLDKSNINLENCSLTKEGVVYKLVLDYNRNSLREFEENFEVKGGADRGSCSTSLFRTTIYLNKKGKVIYFHRETVSKMFVRNVVNTWVTTTINEDAYFTELKENSVLKTF